MGDDALVGSDEDDDLEGGGGTNTNDGGEGEDHCINPDPAGGAINCELP
jgi:Ca2+-binding RTX toxin-like protein